MFDSGISTAKMVSELKNEVDIAIPIPNESYILWLNALEQLLYREVIQEEKTVSTGMYIDYVSAEDAENYSYSLSLAGLTPDTPPQNLIRFEDVKTIYIKDTQLIKSTQTSGGIFPNTFYKADEYDVEINTTVSLSGPDDIKIIYFVKPALKTVDESDNINEGNVMLPTEFIDMAKAKLRGEAYKIANEDALAAKWLNDYNILLENFKVWVAGKAPQFGM